MLFIKRSVFESCGCVYRHIKFERGFRYLHQYNTKATYIFTPDEVDQSFRVLKVKR